MDDDQYNDWIQARMIVNDRYRLAHKRWLCVQRNVPSAIDQLKYVECWENVWALGALKRITTGCSLSSALLGR